MRESLKEVSELISHLKTASILDEKYDTVTLGIVKATGQYCFLVSIHGLIATDFCFDLFTTFRSNCFEVSVISHCTDMLIVQLLQKQSLCCPTELLWSNIHYSYFFTVDNTILLSTNTFSRICLPYSTFIFPISSI